MVVPLNYSNAPWLVLVSEATHVGTIVLVDIMLSKRVAKLARTKLAYVNLVLQIYKVVIIVNSARFRIRMRERSL
jgi:hypothetical protein